MPQELLGSFTTGGVSVFVGTVDAEGLPTCCRGIAIASRDDFDTITVYVPAATGQETVANVATTRRVAISCSRPLTHETIQIKGVTRGVRLAPASEESFVRGRLADFGRVLEEIGFPHTITSRIACWPAFAIDVSVEQIFDQTPGPNAGAEVKR